MQNAVEETFKKSNGHKITVSGDGTWQTRGVSSLHGIVDILSAVPTAKVRIRLTYFMFSISFLGIRYRKIIEKMFHLYWSSEY